MSPKCKFTEVVGEGDNAGWGGGHSGRRRTIRMKATAQRRGVIHAAKDSNDRIQYGRRSWQRCDATASRSVIDTREERHKDQRGGGSAGAKVAASEDAGKTGGITEGERNGAAAMAGRNQRGNCRGRGTLLASARE